MFWKEAGHQMGGIWRFRMDCAAMQQLGHSPCNATPPLHTRVWHLPGETPSYHSTTKTLGILSLFSASAEWGHLRWKHESNYTWPVRVKKWWQRSALKHMEVFSLVPTLHAFLCCSSSLKYLILKQTLAALEEKPSPITQSRARAGGAPAGTQNNAGKASNLGHTSQSWGLWDELAEAMAVTTELRGLAPS